MVSDYRQSLARSTPRAITSYIYSPDNQKWLTFTNGVLEWAESEGIKELWECQPEFGKKRSVDLDTAHLIFINPLSRGLVGMMLLSEAGDEEIREMIGERIGLEFNEDALAIYRRIFYDIGMMGREDWPGFISQIGDKEERHYLALGLGKPSENECRDMAGLTANLDLDVMMKEMLSISYTRLREACLHPNPAAANIEMWHSQWLKVWDRTEKRGRDADAANPIATGDYTALFSVIPTVSNHVSLSDLKGHLSAGAGEKKEQG